MIHPAVFVVCEVVCIDVRNAWTDLEEREQGWCGWSRSISHTYENLPRRWLV